MIATCPLCHTPTQSILATKLRRGEGIVYHCAECDLGFLTNAKSINYSGEYRERVSHRAAGGPATPQEVFDAYRLYQGDRLRLVEPYLHKDAAVLEIGAGAGQFIHHLKDRAGKLAAIEPDFESRKFMEKTGIETAAYLAARNCAVQFDLVCAFQVLEHVEDPVAFLREVKAILKPGGHAVIEVPSLYDPLRSVWKNDAYEEFFFHDAHRWYFSPKATGIVKDLAGFTWQQATIHYLQDYTLLNHLHWHLTGQPQATNHEGLRMPAHTRSNDPRGWVMNQLAYLNAEYVERLKKAGQTSNIAVVLTT